MTAGDKEQYKRIVEKWEAERGEAGKKMYDTAKALGSAGTDYFADYPELAVMLDIDNKMDVTYATSMGGRASTGGLNALEGGVAKLLGVPDENIKSYEEKMALDAANAQTQHKVAYNTSRNLTQMAKDYAFLQATKGLPGIGRLLDQSSTLDALRAGNTFWGKVGNVAKTAGKNTLLGMPFDIASDTTPEAIYNAYLGKSGQEIAGAAAENIVGNAIGNMVGELAIEPGFQLLGEAFTRKAAKEAAELAAEQTAKEAAEYRAKAAAENELTAEQMIARR
jgi:hypothetical protein